MKSVNQLPRLAFRSAVLTDYPVGNGTTPSVMDVAESISFKSSSLSLIGESHDAAWIAKDNMNNMNFCFPILSHTSTDRTFLIQVNSYMAQVPHSNFSKCLRLHDVYKGPTE